MKLSGVLTLPHVAAVLAFLCYAGVDGKPSFSFGFRHFAGLNGGGGGDASGAPRAERDLTYKNYSGVRVKNDSLLMVYYHDQTVGVVELGPKKLLLNCELIEVYEPEEATKILTDLQKISRPLLITFPEMLDLMHKCQQLDTIKAPKTPSPQVRSANAGRGLLSNNPLTLFSGILPGTKWCGTGDIAENYHDLGSEAAIDRCCRTHDLCPIKVRAYTKRYNLTNNSLYTKSHCRCDDDLFKCLKRSNHPSGNLMGNVYFNLVQVPCLEDTENGQRRFRSPRSNFR